MDIIWDTMPPSQREGLALEQAKATALFAKSHVPFYVKHYAGLSENRIADIATLEEFACILPEVTRSHLSTNPHHLFLPHDNGLPPRKEGYRVKGTGGSTGRPIAIFYSPADWRAMAQHLARSIHFDFRHTPEELRHLTVMGLYHGDHVTNDIYQSGFSLLGVAFLGRVSTRTDVQANYDFFQQEHPSAILAPPEDPMERQTKGITLDKFLQLDARNTHPGAFRMNHGHNPRFRAIFWSSMPISQDLQEYILNHLEIPYQQAQYGSTEVCPTGATCRHHPRDFHLGYGPSLLLVKALQGNRLAEEEEVGCLLTSRTGAVEADGTRCVPTGTLMLNYRVGDFGRLKNLHGTPCPCGRNTPVLFDLHRQEHAGAKLRFGCQVD